MKRNYKSKKAFANMADPGEFVLQSLLKDVEVKDAPNYIIGTESERLALTPKEGLRFYQTNSSGNEGVEYIYKNGEWELCNTPEYVSMTNSLGKFPTSIYVTGSDYDYEYMKAAKKMLEGKYIKFNTDTDTFISLEGTTLYNQATPKGYYLLTDTNLKLDSTGNLYFYYNGMRLNRSILAPTRLGVNIQYELPSNPCNYNFYKLKDSLPSTATVDYIVSQANENAKLIRSVCGMKISCLTSGEATNENSQSGGYKATLLETLIDIRRVNVETGEITMALVPFRIPTFLDVFKMRSSRGGKTSSKEPWFSIFSSPGRNTHLKVPINSCITMVINNTGALDFLVIDRDWGISACGSAILDLEKFQVSSCGSSSQGVSSSMEIPDLPSILLILEY